VFSQPSELTKTTPGGCLLGLAGLALLLVAALCGWGLFLALTSPPENAAPGLAWKFALGLLISLSLGTSLICLGWKLALGADMKAPDSRDKPKVRF